MRHVEAGPEGARLGVVEVAGADPACVYLHGLGSSSAHYFAPVVAQAAWPGRRALLVDLLGTGISDHPGSFSYSMFDHADVVAGALASLGGTSYDIVAHSMSGAIAVVLAHRHPDLVRRLVLIEPSLGPTPRPRTAGQSEAQFAADGYRRALAEAGPFWRATMQLTDPVALYREDVALGDPELARLPGWLTGLPMPVLLVRGSASGYEEEFDLGGLTVPQAVIGGAGHSPMVDDPAAMAAVLAGFLQ